jgi:uncharacterized membrane protein
MDRPMSPEAQLSYESHRRTRQTIVAVAAGVLLMVAAVIDRTGAHAKVSELTLSLIVDHQRKSVNLISAVINAVAQIVMVSTLWYLWRCASARRGQDDQAADSAESRPGSARRTIYVPIIAVLGGVLTIAGTFGYLFDLDHAADQFVSTGQQTYDQGHSLLGAESLFIWQEVELLAALLLAVAFVLVCVQAMRVGLLPRFLGYIGMFAGALILIPIIQVPVVQLYFLVSVGLLIAGQWPSGSPRAWLTGRAEAWPSSAEVRARRMAEAEESRAERQTRQGRRGRRPDAAAPASAETVDAPSTTDTAPSTVDDSGRTHQGARPNTPQRRKRKHRR